jgi:hypothetical protein
MNTRTLPHLWPQHRLKIYFGAFHYLHLTRKQTKWVSDSTSNTIKLLV